MIRKIKLVLGEFTILDNEDYEKLSLFSWFLDKGYAKRVAVKGKDKKVSMHREIMNAPKGFDVDHINFNKLDNRKINLRICSREQNNKHREKYKNNTTGYKGIKFRKDLISKPFVARITVDGKEVHLGYFKNKKEAAFAYNLAAIKYFKEFAHLNIIKEK